MLINVSGVSGAGKSWVMREILKKYHSVEITETAGWNRSGAPTTVAYELLNGLCVAGRYNPGTAGGLESIKPPEDRRTDARVNLIVRLSQKYPFVLYESLMISTSVKRFKEVQGRGEGPLLVGFLDTPFDLCMQQIQQRNGGKPVKEHLMKLTYDRLLRLRGIIFEEGIETRVIDHTNSVEVMLDILREHGWQD